MPSSRDDMPKPVSWQRPGVRSRRVQVQTGSFERTTKPPSRAGVTEPTLQGRQAAEPSQREVASTRRAGISFLSRTDARNAEPEPAEWQRYVDDRLRHFTISHR